MKRICTLLLVVTAILFSAQSMLAGETKVGAVIFTNWQMELNDQSRGKSFNEFKVTRARAIVDHTFDAKFAANLMIDADPTSDGSYDDMQVRLRQAYLQINQPVKHLDLRIGMQGLLWFDHLEKAWGLRYIDPLSLDKLGYLPRADIGASIIGTCPGNYGQLALQILNGSGYKGREMNKYKDFALMATVYPLPKNPDFGESGAWLQYYKGWPNISSTTATKSFSEFTRKNRLQLAGVLKYRKWITGVAEYFMAQDKENAAVDNKDINIEEASGFSLLGRLQVATSETWLSRVYVYGKYEWVDKHKNATDNLAKDNGDAKYLTTGVGYEPIDGFHFSVNVKRGTINEVIGNTRVQENEENFLSFNMMAAF